MAHYTFTYTAVATNVSLAALVTAMAAVPRDLDYEAELGLAVVSDSTAGVTANACTRTIQLVSLGTGPVADPGIAAFLENIYTQKLATALSTSIQASGVTVT